MSEAAELVDLAQAVIIDNEDERDFRGNHATMLARGVLDFFADEPRSVERLKARVKQTKKLHRLRTICNLLSRTIREHDIEADPSVLDAQLLNELATISEELDG